MATKRYVLLFDATEENAKRIRQYVGTLQDMPEKPNKKGHRIIHIKFDKNGNPKHTKYSLADNIELGNIEIKKSD